MGAVRKVPVPPDSRLAPRVRPGDYTDAYACASSLSPRDAARIGTDFPGWVRALLALRQLAVTPFGLRGPATSGDRAGIFPVEADHGDELILGFDDRHLDFRISVLQGGGVLTVTTWVRRHNLLGRVYLAAVLPFHVAIARGMVARIARAGAARTVAGPGG